MKQPAQRAREVVAQGYTATKWFFRHDPTEGQEGMRKNLALIQAVREAVGPDVEIMFDAWSSWNVPYTQRMAELAAEYRPWWFEEPVMADMIPQYAELRRTVSAVAIAGGEHEYTRWGIKALLDAGKDVSIVDTRTLEEFEERHFAGAISMPSDEVEQRHGELPRAGDIVFY